MHRKWVKIAALVMLVFLPVIVYLGYRKLTGLPKRVVIATGPQHGLYRKIAEGLAEEIRANTRMKVEVRSTSGSLDNLLLLQAGEVDFALYQPATIEVVQDNDPDFLAQAKKDVPQSTSRGGNLAFVANLYSQPAHFIVRRDAGITSAADLTGKTVSLGLRGSGDYAMSCLLLAHFGLDQQSIKAKYLNYEDVKKGFENDELDAAFITIGIQAPVFAQLFATGKCDMVAVDDAEALTTKHVSISPYKIPKGLYQSQPPEPPLDIDTVAMGAQLLTRDDVNAALVYKVAQLVTDESFLKEHQLGELFLDRKFAREKPEFATHPGAVSFFNPEVDLSMVESAEAVYSLAASLFIASFLGLRWLHNRRMKRKEHRLDRYMRSLLDIERRQIGLDHEPGGGDAARLGELLDEVTLLRQEALRAFTAHELNEDRGADCFVHMCHALSDKINAKISRQRLDHRIDELTEALDALAGKRG